MDELRGKVEQLTLRLQELFECPICFVTMDSTLKQCVNGHAVCSSCAAKIDKCSICQQKLVLEICQNTFIQNMLEYLPKRCPFADQGCNNIVFDQEHQNYCEYRLSKCKKDACDWKGPVKNLLEHIRICDKGNSLLKVSSLNTAVLRTYTLEATDGEFTPIVFQNQVFWKYWKLDVHANFISHKLLYLPTSKPTCNYYMIISFNKGVVEFAHTCKAIATDDEHSVAESGLKIPASELNYLCNPGSEHQYEYTFKLVKEDIP